MSYINKFGESSIKNNLNSNSRLRTCKQNLQISNITKDMQQIYTTIKIFKEEFRNENVDFSNKIEKKLKKIEELKNEYESQLNIIRSDIKTLKENNKKILM